MVDGRWIGQAIGVDPGGPEHGDMNATPNDDRRLFERLCLLRALYGRRGPRDSVSVMSVSAAIGYAQALLTRPATAAV